MSAKKPFQAPTPISAGFQTAQDFVNDASGPVIPVVAPAAPKPARKPAAPKPAAARAKAVKTPVAAPAPAPAKPPTRERRKAPAPAMVAPWANASAKVTSPFLLRLPEATHMKLMWLKNNLPNTSLQKLVLDAVDKEVEQLLAKTWGRK